MLPHRLDLWVLLSEGPNAMDVRPMLVPPLKRWLIREQIRLAGGNRQRLGALRDWIECGYQHPLLALVLIPLLIHVPRPMVRLPRLWTSCEIQPSRVATGGVCRAIFYPIGGLGLQLLHVVPADCHPLRHAGRVRRARRCAREVRGRFGWCPGSAGHKPICKPNGHSMVMMAKVDFKFVMFFFFSA